MSPKQVKNIAASVRQKLLTKAKSTNRPFNEVLQYYAMERFLYRISKSNYSGNFILKGALMFTVLRQLDTRSTLDIDLLGKINNNPDNIIRVFQEICDVDIEPDGLVFDRSSVSAEQITVDADYQGVRVKLSGSLGNARIRIQIDIGFSDVITPGPEKIEYPTILDLPAPVLNCYNKETMIAEKFQAMIKLDILNSRMKDFYDIWLLADRYEFDGQHLCKTIINTFKTRDTDIVENPVVFTSEYFDNTDKITQWRAFIRKNKITNVPAELEVIIHDIENFLKPVIMSISKDSGFGRVWTHSKKWE